MVGVLRGCTHLGQMFRAPGAQYHLSPSVSQMNRECRSEGSCTEHRYISHRALL
jgi:hypothetical protein